MEPARAGPGDDLLARALEQQLAEQRSLNELLARVDEALSEVRARMDGVEQRLAAQERAVASVAGVGQQSRELAVAVQRGLDEQAAHLAALRDSLVRDAGTGTAQLEALTTEIAALTAEVAQRFTAVVEGGAERFAAQARELSGEQTGQLEALRAAVSGDLVTVADQVRLLVDAVGGVRGALTSFERGTAESVQAAGSRLTAAAEQVAGRFDAVVQGSAERFAAQARGLLGEQVGQLESLRAAVSGDLAATAEQVGLLVAAVGEVRQELAGHVRTAAESVADAAGRLSAAGEGAAALSEAAVALRDVEAEISDSLARLGEGLDRAAEQAARAARIRSTRALQPALRRLEQLGDTFVERLAGAQPELTCRTCGFTAKNAAGLAAHRRSHG